MNAIAGILNDAGNVMGLMPHPERSLEALLGSTDGVGMFESLCDAVEWKLAHSGMDSPRGGDGLNTGGAPRDRTEIRQAGAQ